MAKKKKSQLKPVARGFATTSVPKKLAAADELALASDISEELTQGPNVGVNGNASASGFSVDAEEQSLQNIVDKYQEKTEKEITRTIKAIEFERRFSKSLPKLDLDTAYQEGILQLVLDDQSSNAASGVTLEEPEEKALPRLGITYGVLRRLGFGEERVIECLSSIHGIDLDEAFEWLHLHCPEEELTYEKPVVEPRTPRTPRTPVTFQTTIAPSSGHASDTRHLETPTFASQQPIPWEPRDSNTAKLRVLASYGSESLSPSEGTSSDEEIDDPNLQYARAKIKLTILEVAAKRNNEIDHDSVLLGRLRSRIKLLKSHYLFRVREAEALYHLEKSKADQAALEQRLSGKVEPATTRLPLTTASSDFATMKEIRRKEMHRPPQLQSVVSKSNSPPGDLFDDEFLGGTSGGVFGTLLDTVPESEVANGVQVRIRDIPLPKHWAGRTPKTLLWETVQKADRYAIVSYRLLPDTHTSRAKRAAVTVRWEGAKTDEWSMDDVGCWDEGQAEQYVSTVALHDVTFGHSEGFAGGISGVSGGSAQTYFRLLPPVFRDLWDELESKRRDADDRRNREVWATLRRIIEPKLGGNKKHIDISPAGYVKMRQDFFKVKSRFLARQASPAYQHMLVQRNNLPISHYRDEIISTLERSQVMVLSGETGCGKSTQLPAYILEDHLSRGQHCKIYCTEPRRISAISLAQRVSLELGEPPGSVGTLTSLVGYTIRLESNTTRNTKLAFVTNGIALRMLEGGSGNGGHGTAFDEITHIVIDEVHERNLDSDFILIVLKTLIEQRRDLKVILMSATMDAQKISDFFGGCPTLHVPGRTFPVDIRFLEDTIEYTGWSIKEGSPYAKRPGDRSYRNGKHKVDWNEDTANVDDEDDTVVPQEFVKLEKRYSPATKATVDLLDERLIPYELIVRLLERLCFEDTASIQYSAATLIFMPGLAEIRRLNDILSEHPLFGVAAGFRIFPLHSSISSENQAAVFELTPPGVRKIVISTNIAETGVTIPDITCVIDSGKHREMRFDEKRQISRLIETLIAKSNAAQRRGRAGRVQPGICFHLFTRARHDQQMTENPLPEMLRLSLSDLALRIKILKVKIGTSIEDVLSRALDPPSQINVQRAVQALVEVKALTPSQDITPMGRLLSKLPTDVHLGKFLLVATIFKCLDPALTIAAALNSKSPFVTPFGLEQEADNSRKSFQSDNSDFLTIHNAFASWRRASSNAGFVRKFCRQNFLSHQNLQQIEELRQQFLGYLIDSEFIQVSKAYVMELSRARYGRHKTRFVNVPEELDCNSNDHTILNAALITGLYPKVLMIDPSIGQMRTVTNNQAVAFHPSSINFMKKVSDFGVNYLCYFTIMQSKKLYAWETGPIDNMALVLLCGDSEVKLSSETVMLDRKIKFRVGPKACAALRHLRDQFTAILALKMRRMPITEAQERWYSLALTVLGRTTPEEVFMNGTGPAMLVNGA
ncbi:P-loop containing nucleoside triphosphate hydrolase protein [Ramaria rubella]|nr:P-loop containing nucleoside triphosphate hydrolase protein [Ramaria rubella]